MRITLRRYPALAVCVTFTIVYRWLSLHRQLLADYVSDDFTTQTSSLDLIDPIDLELLGIERETTTTSSSSPSPSNNTNKTKARREKKTDFWERTDSCFAVDDVCRRSTPNRNGKPRNDWFYYVRSGSSAAEDVLFQPTMELKSKPSYPLRDRVNERVSIKINSERSVGLGSEARDATYARYRKPPFPAPSLPWQANTVCQLSSPGTVVVLQSAFNDMLGEFYVRTLVRLHNLIHAGNGNTSDTHNDEDVRFLVHMAYKDKHLLDGHRLTLEGISGGTTGAAVNNLTEAALLLEFLDGDDRGGGDTSSCECYQKLIFCGYDVKVQKTTEQSSQLPPLLQPFTTLVDADTDNTNQDPLHPAGVKLKYTLWPSKVIRDLNPDQLCMWMRYNTTVPCRDVADLRNDMAKNLDRKHPTVWSDVAEYRRRVLRERGYPIRDRDDDTDGKGGNHDDKDDVMQWTFIGLTQRTYRRAWVNLNETIAECERRFPPLSTKVICVEINVERMQSPHEQLVAHRALNALMGIHGAQLTQAVFLPRHAHVLEILPWIPSYMLGDWVQVTHHPTPVGIMYHNTDLTHAGYKLGRRSTMMCEGVGGVAGNGTVEKCKGVGGVEGNVTAEKECECFLGLGRKFSWAKRDFRVDSMIVSNYVEKFLMGRKGRQDEHPSCKDLRRRAGASFVLYNAWCQPEGILTGNRSSVHHFYHPNPNPDKKK